MARKTHLPSPSSSSEDDAPPVPPPQITKKQPPPSSAAAGPKPPKQPQPPPSSSEEDASSDSESESDSPPPAKSPAPAMVTAPPPPSKAPLPSKAPAPATSSQDEEDEEEEEEDDDDSGSEPDEPEKTPKPPSPMPVEPQKPQKTPEKKRKAPDTPSGKDAGPQAREEPNAKRVIERLWSGADEILLLKGMIEFQARHGHEPTSLNDAAVLLEIISKGLHAEFTPSQLLSKFRHTKRKYAAHLTKDRADGETLIHKPHEKEMYNLSKQVWGNMDVKRRQPAENGKKTTGRRKAAGVAGASPMKRIKGNNTNDGSVMTATATVPVIEGEVGLSLTADMSLILEEMRRTGASSEKMEMLKECLRIVKPDTITGLAESWRELRGEEVRLWNKQTELVGNVLKAALSGMHK